jgi:hypothetical protein
MATQSQALNGDSNLDQFTMQDCARIRQFLYDLTDPDMYGFTVKDPEIRRRALDLLTMDIFK